MVSGPADRPRPAVPSYRGAAVRFALPTELCKAVEALAHREGCTPYMVLVSAFQALLGRYSGQGAAAIKLNGVMGKEGREFVYETTFAPKTGEDKDFVERLTVALAARDKDVWIDVEDIRGGAAERERDRTRLVGLAARRPRRRRAARPAPRDAPHLGVARAAPAPGSRRRRPGRGLERHDFDPVSGHAPVLG